MIKIESIVQTIMGLIGQIIYFFLGLLGTFHVKRLLGTEYCVTCKDMQDVMSSPSPHRPQTSLVDGPIMQKTNRYSEQPYVIKISDPKTPVRLSNGL